MLLARPPPRRVAASGNFEVRRRVGASQLRRRTRPPAVLLVRAAAGGGSEAPADVTKDFNNLDWQNYGRVQTLTDRQLRQRMSRMSNVDKLVSLTKVLDACGKADLADEARLVLYRVCPSAAEQLRAASTASSRGSSGSGTGAARGASSADGGAAAAEGGDGGAAEAAEAAEAGGLKRVVLSELDKALMKNVARELERHGAQVHLPTDKSGGSASAEFDWGLLAGYEEQKQQIEEMVLLTLSYPDLYDELARATKKDPEAAASNRPRALLLEGPPGTGKTTCARVLAQQAAVPLVVVNFAQILSCWYGESEERLHNLFKACDRLSMGAIIFMDELDGLVGSREGRMHEATRRLLGVLLQHLDGFDHKKKTVFIGATNRKADLDPALRSRFAASVKFDLPGEEARVEILRQYAYQLSTSDLQTLARATRGMSGRDLKAVCDHTERRWIAEVIRGRADRKQLPSLMAYLSSAQHRSREAGPRIGLDIDED